VLAQPFCLTSATLALRRQQLRRGIQPEDFADLRSYGSRSGWQRGCGFYPREKPSTPASLSELCPPSYSWSAQDV
jgi:hypothetical protein